jgi:hypothetical protein
MHVYERKNSLLETSGPEPEAQIYQKEKFDAETKPPHSNDVQRQDPKLGYRDLRIKNKNQAMRVVPTKPKRAARKQEDEIEKRVAAAHWLGSQP